MGATQTDAVEELSQVLGEVSETVTVKVQGKSVDVTVSPFRLREFANILKCVQRLRAAGAITSDAIKQVTEAESAEEAKKGFDFLKMLLDGGDEIINILSIAAGKQLQAHVLNNLDLVDGARLASAVFAVNLDFFYRNRETIKEALAPVVKAIESVATNGVEVLGRPPLTDSSERAIG